MKKVDISITIDVENPQTPLFLKKFKDNRIWSSGWGIQKIIEVLDRNDVKGDFFTNVYEYIIWGRKEMRGIVQTIHNAGHTVQLHTHPIWIDRKRRENMNQFSLEEQRSIIDWGLNFIRTCINKRPLCHRAGAYGFDNNTLIACKDLGIKVDTSYFHGHASYQLIFPENIITEWNGVIEMPVTFIRNNNGRIIKTDIDWMSLDQFDSFLDMAYNHKEMRFVNLFLHSYSLTKTKDGFVSYLPDADKVKKFENIIMRIKDDYRYRFRPLYEAALNSI
jgi:peptidoglycan/xylan/chitin deacetylase (PgdA/CDA1 family)